MTWELLSTGGPWAIAMAVAWAVWNGHLVLGREMRDAKDAIAKLTDQLSSATETMAASQAEERRRMQQDIADLKAELAQQSRGEPT